MRIEQQVYKNSTGSTITFVQKRKVVAMTLTCLKSQKCNIEWRWVILSSVRDHDSCWEEIQNGLNVHYHQRLNLRGQEIRVSSTFSLHILTLTLRTTHMKFSTIKEISLPWKPEWGDKVKHAGKHMEPIDRKVKHIAEIRAKFQEHIIHNFFLRIEHLEILWWQETVDNS